jgi:hypothetical protein
MFVEEGFDAIGKDPYPNLACGFDECDGTEVIEGDVLMFFWDGVEEAPFPGWCALPMGPEVGEVQV